MRRNRKVSTRISVMAQNTAHAAVILVMTFIMAIVNLLAKSSCSQLLKSIGEKERLLSRLEDERSRESARWEEMKTPEKLEQALARHGLAMRYAKPGQVVRMKADGQPQPGQISVAKALQRQNAAASSVAMAKTPASRTAKRR